MPFSAFALPSIVPLPSTLQWNSGSYTFPSESRISFTPGAEKAALFLEKLIKPMGPVSFVPSNGNLRISKDQSLVSVLGQEGYELDIASDGILLKAAGDAGLFYGIQTLRQMLPSDLEKGAAPAGPVVVACAHIQDIPLCAWRGSMLDVARRYFGPEYLKQHVDRMALYKLNRFHLHLTDDAGWRIEIKSRPNLTAHGSLSAVNHGPSGYLTQDEYKDLQEYALERHITIVPEIDMPGHIYSALASYPELNCANFSNLTPINARPPALFYGTQNGWSSLCLEKAETRAFVDTVLAELASITAGPWIHFGADEVNQPLYGDFVRSVVAKIAALGKTPIGWEEMTDANPAKPAIAQLWLGNRALNGFSVINSRATYFYLDHANVPGQPNTDNWAKSDGISLEHVYSFRFGRAGVQMGVEAPLWTHMVTSRSEADGQLWPRLAAVAEVAWTPEALRNFSGFASRIAQHGKRLCDMGAHFYPTPGISWNGTNVSTVATSAYNGFIPDTKQLTEIRIARKDPMKTTTDPRFSVHFQNGKLRFVLPGREPCQISVVDLAGKEIWSSKGRQSGISEQGNMDVGKKLKQGVYIARIESAALRETVKFVVAH